MTLLRGAANGTRNDNDADPQPSNGGVLPLDGGHLTPLVALGGSAGAIAALQAFLQAMPPQPTGIAFLVALHLSASHESALAEVLQHSTGMQVRQVTERVRIEPDTVYVTPPGKTIRTMGTELVLDESSPEQGRLVTIDELLRALAESHGMHAAAVILSGMDGDGANGLKRIKEYGGLTVVQDPSEAEHPGMPRSSIDTGIVDLILPVTEMPARLINYFEVGSHLRLPAENVAGIAPAPRTPDSDEAALREVLAYLRTRTGRDFSDYKRATTVRRIGRRMQVNGVETMQAYVDCLRTHPNEASALLQDLLISVTNFFRDPECFAALEPHLAQLFAGKGSTDTIRVWVAACATGEEAYSIAILLSEYARQMEAPPLIQVFATDLDEQAIRTARAGLYPLAIEPDVAPDRLRRYFTKEHGGWRLRREIRDLILFAQHDLLKDSPFSRVDLISCRNLLIYLNRTAQLKLFQTFHFALRPQGLLFLGSSESAEEGADLFGVIDKKHRIFIHRPTARLSLPVPNGPGTLALALGSQRAARADGPPQLAATGRPPPAVSEAVGSWAEVHFRMLEVLGPPSVLADHEHEICHVSAHAAPFLRFGAGEPSHNLLRVVHPDLRIELRAALYEAAQTHQPVEVLAGPADLGQGPTRVRLRAVPLHGFGNDLFVVTFDTSSVAPGGAQAEEADGPPPALARHLESELERLKSHLRETVEQYEASTEELKASNEELLAMNEELRSATEELETSREELQSINEELTTVNHELKAKVDELGHANSDMHNLMDATAIATVFLDRELRVMRYTPSAVSLFNLIPTDLGRPLRDLATGLDYPHLTEDARAVLDRLAPVEREVGLPDGKWFLARVRPYRTLEDRIGGVVLSFIDITERKRSEEVRLWLSAVVAHSNDAIVSFAADGVILSWNNAAVQMLGWTASEAIGRSMELLATDAERETLLRHIRTGEPLQNLQASCRRKDGGTLDIQLNVAPIRDAKGQLLGATAVARDITEARRAADALRGSEERMRMMVENAHEYAIFALDLDRRVTLWNVGAQRLLGYSEEEVKGQSGDVIFTEEDRRAGAPDMEAQTALETGRAADDRFHVRKDGSQFWASGVSMVMRDARGEKVGLLKILRDQTAEREARSALEKSRGDLMKALAENQKARHELEVADEAKDRFLAMLSHELRNPLASIVSAGELLTTPGTPPANITKAANVVRRQSGNMKAQLDDLLDISRLRLGHGLGLRPQLLTVASVIDSAVESSAPAVDAGHHLLKVHEVDPALRVHGDPVRLAQVVANLITNSARYTPEGGRIDVRVEVDGGQFTIVVSDNGIGIEPAEIERMFEIFTQASNPGQQSRGGLGIGLALTRSIVEMHGGTVSAESPGLGLGCTVRVRMPLAGTSGGIGDAAHDEPDGAATAATGLVLIADDNHDVAWSMASLLQINGYDTLTAHGGSEALALAQEHQPMVMVVDVGMPDISGHEVARRVRQAPWGRDIVLIALTGWGQDSDIRASVAAGFELHLTKPVDANRVNEVIQQAMARRRKKLN